MEQTGFLLDLKVLVEVYFLPLERSSRIHFFLVCTCFHGSRIFYLELFFRDFWPRFYIEVLWSNDFFLQSILDFYWNSFLFGLFFQFFKLFSFLFQECFLFDRGHILVFSQFFCFFRKKIIIPAFNNLFWLLKKSITIGNKSKIL